MSSPMKRIALSAAALALGFTLTACGQNGTMTQKNTRANDNINQKARQVNPLGTDGSMRNNQYGNGNGNNGAYNTYNTRNNDGMTRGTGTNGGTAQNNTEQTRASRQLTALAEKVQGVNRAVVLVNNNDAVVGLDTNNKNTAGIEKNVRNTLQRKYPTYKFHITSDKKLTTRIKGLYTQHMGGSNGSGNGSMNGSGTSNMNSYGTNSMNGYGTSNMNGYGTNNLDGYGYGTRSMNGYDNGNGNGNNGLFGNNNRGSVNHPIRTLADDIGDVIRDIGNAVTAPLR